MGKYFRPYVPTSINRMSNKNKNDKYKGLLSSQQLRDLGGETELVTYINTREEKERAEKIRKMGCSSNMADGAGGNIMALGNGYDTSNSENEKRVKKEAIEYMREKNRFEMDEFIDKKRRGVI